MYWEDDIESKRKLRREEKLRAKKFGQEPPMEEASISHDSPAPAVIREIITERTIVESSNGESVEELKEIINKQDEKLDSLSSALLQQQELLKAILEKDNSTTIIREVAHGEGETQGKAKFIKLDDIDVDVIDTSGIEAVGDAAGTVTTGQNITSQVEKLRMLKKLKKKE